MYDGRVIEAAVRDMTAAHAGEEDLANWFRTRWLPELRPLAADVWVFTPDFRRILVVEHCWRGLVPPGGRVEPGETQREGAIRELAEETGLELLVDARPAFAAARAYREDWPPTLNLSYWTVADPASELTPEPGQPARWVDVDSKWRTFHTADSAVIAGFAATQRPR
ncbi:NUDIX domain-containing protein [Arthrobacter sp. B3I4]|uniref:NUDIX domain-containing protein n=1 Tax=Arthrobacter sp. B3I4 TaxID=3042267 RepID=UPI002783446E|nr:NUDIX hydrolase [Arthrobacter sp. B3I4]MDQ0756343.1 8-oxo-dGTP diphosphatase [Arthrobacter sp. B3I4]